MPLSFLLRRPIAVTMFFLSLTVLSALALRELPVTLLPAVEVPQLVVKAAYPNGSPEEVEENLLRPLRERFATMRYLERMESRAYPETGLLTLYFDYGAPMGLLYIEANEQVDQLMGDLPREMARPQVSRVNTADVPLVRLQVVPREANADLPALSELVEKVIRKRIEGLSGVSVVESNGGQERYWRMEPKAPQLAAVGLTEAALTASVAQAFAPLGELSVKDGPYRYFLRLDNPIALPEKLRQLPIALPNGQSVPLGTLADIRVEAQVPLGWHLANGQPALVLTIHASEQAQTGQLSEQISQTVAQLHRDFPQLQFALTQDQGFLLQLSISNLLSSLLLGGGFAFAILFLFFGQIRLPLLMGLSIPVSVMLGFLVFYLTGLTLNLLSLSGLALGVGMLIDNAIIVLDNITGKWQAQQQAPDKLLEACVEGTTEMVAPLLSSVLTTLAVFVPLVFLNGLSGALFQAQAIAVAATLGTSLLVAFVLLPLGYLYVVAPAPPSPPVDGGEQNTPPVPPVNGGEQNTPPVPPVDGGENAAPFSTRGESIAPFPVNGEGMGLGLGLTHGAFAPVLRLHQRIHHALFTHQRVSLLGFLAVIALGWWPLTQLPVAPLPPLEQTATWLQIAWNEPIPVEENRRRIQALLAVGMGKNNVPDADTAFVCHTEADIGVQQFSLQAVPRRTDQADVYAYLANEAQRHELEREWAAWLSDHYPQSTYQFSAPATAFSRLFAAEMPELEVRFRQAGEGRVLPDSLVRGLLFDIPSLGGWQAAEGMNTLPALQLRVDMPRLEAYRLDYAQLTDRLSALLGEAAVADVRLVGERIPIRARVGDSPSPAQLAQAYINGQDASGRPVPVPLRSLLTWETVRSPQAIWADEAGPYQAVSWAAAEPMLPQLPALREQAAANGIQAQWTGQYFASRENVRQLTVVLLVAVGLLYLILAAQFESLWQPLLVLILLPGSLAGCFTTLWLSGGSLNVLSGIGAVVMLGIVVNDAILKVDTLNRMRKSDPTKPLAEIVAQASDLRLKPILMTSLTTILALLPVLFFAGLGADLQRPLVYAVVGGLTAGTLLSVYFVPMVYLAVFRSRRGCRLPQNASPM